MSAEDKNLLLALAQVKADEKALAERKAEIESALVLLMQTGQTKTVSMTTEDGKAIKGTLVEGQRVKYDEAKMKKSLGATLWAKVTKQVLDTAKLEAAITLGEVDANKIAAAAEVTDSKPYVRLSGDTVASSLASAPVKRVRKVVPKPVLGK